MNILELKKKFEQEKINPYLYSFVDDPLQECYCMLKDDIGWEVFFRERGEKREIRWFKSESEACKYLEYMIFSDEIYRAGGKAVSWDDFKKSGQIKKSTGS